MRRKIGRLCVSGHKFPIWIENKWGKDIFEIEIYCESTVVDILMESLAIERFYSRFSGDTKTVLYKLNTRLQVEERLKSIGRDELVDIDFKKLSDFLMQVDKKYVVERLEGKD